ncbi:MAG: hypothetical protein Q7V63_03885 [Gammaproteobacteria bacterium]|nr:hypothetical protein [Gammaproteobacteria bacterium]
MILETEPRENQEPQNKLAKLKAHPGVINGEPDELIHQDWLAEWVEYES